MGKNKGKVTPYLWFNDNAEEAMDFYASVFKNSSIGTVTRFGPAGPGPEGSLIVGRFTIEGQEFMVMNGGPMYEFTEAISLFIECDTQDEIDYYWETLSKGGKKGRCGWLKDKFGLSWQIIPSRLEEIWEDKDPDRSLRTMKAMLKMNKMNIKKLEAAYVGK